MTIHGRNFLDLPSLACKIGAAIVPGTFRSSELVACEMPPSSKVFGTDEGYSDGSHLASTRITVSINGIDWHEEQSATFSYYREPRLVSLHPSVVPPEGGTVVQIHFDGELIDGQDELVVQVGKVIVPATTLRHY